MTVFVFWLVLSIAVAVGADRHGRSPGGWLLLSLLISPLLAGVLLIAAGPKAPRPVLSLQPVRDWNTIDWASGQIVEPARPLPSVMMIVTWTTLGTLGFLVALFGFIAFMGS